jgi:hypothetical protein
MIPQSFVKVWVEGGGGGALVVWATVGFPLGAWRLEYIMVLVGSLGMTSPCRKFLTVLRGF